jgi:hypothetical protein
VETPFRSDDTWDYFRRETKSSVTLSKPIGAVLEAADGGVVVAELEEGGSAMSTGSIKTGDRIAAVMDRDVSAATFDEVMGLLRAAPDELMLEVSRSVVIRKNKNATSGAGAEEQQPNKLDAAFQKNFGSTEAAAKLGNKVVKTTLNPTTWKNGIYFWSLMSVVVPLVLIAGYGAVKGN